MEQDQDFSALRNLLALSKLDMPKDTQIDQFLIEFHHRQRVQMLARESLWSRSMGWLKERIAGFELVPSLSYASAFAAIAIAAFVGLSQQVQVTGVAGHPYQLSFRLTPHDTAFAMIPSSFNTAASVSPKLTDNVNFTPTRADSATTRFVLANRSQVAYDATVAF